MDTSTTTLRLFPDVEQPQGAIFPAVDDTSTPSPYTDQIKDNTAVLGGLALQRNNPDKGDLPSFTDQARTLINTGFEERLRDNIAMAHDARNIDYARSAQQDVLTGQADAPLQPLIQQEYKRSLPYTLEEDGVHEIQDQSNTDPTQAWINSMQKNQYGILKTFGDYATKMMLYNREMSSIDKLRQDQGFWGNVSDFFATPFRGLLSNLSGTTDSPIRILDSVGSKLQGRISKLWDPTESVESFATDTLPTFITDVKKHSALFGESYTQEVATLNQMYGVKRGDTAKLYASGVLDMTLIPPTMLANILKSPLKLGMMLGARKQVSESAAITILNDTAGLEHPAGNITRGVDAIAESLPSDIVPSTSDLVSPYVKPMADIVTNIKKMQDTADGIKIIRTQRLEPAQEAEAIEQLKKDLEVRYNRDEIYDIQPTGPRSALTLGDEHENWVTASETLGEGRVPSLGAETAPEKFRVSKDTDTGIISVDLFLGHKYGAGGYATEKSARKGAVDRGLAGYKVIQNADKQFFVQVRHDVKETQVSTPFLSDENMPPVWNFRRFYSNPNTFLNDVLNRTRALSTFQQSMIKEQLFAPILKNISRLNSAETKTLGKILVQGERDQKWYNLSELSQRWMKEHGSNITEKQAMGYYSAKEANDQVWRLFNDNVYINKARRGYVTGSATGTNGFETRARNMLDHLKPDFAKMRRVFDLDEGHTEMDAGVLQKKFETGQHRLLEVEGGYDYGKEPVQYVLAHKRSSTVGPLEHQQLGYVEGGSRENLSHFFVKQVVKGTFEDGSVYYKNPKVSVAARTSKGARDWAAGMEKARLAVLDLVKARKGKSSIVAEIAARDAISMTSVETLEKWEQFVANGEIQAGTKFEVLADKELPHEMSGLGEEVHKWYDPETTGMEQYYNSKGRMYYSKKGERLLDPDQSLAQILDPYRTLSRAVMNASRAAAFHDYSTKVIEDWSRFVLKHGLIEEPKNLDPYHVFFNAKLKAQSRLSPEGKELYSKVDLTRKSHMDLMNMRTEEEALIGQAKARFAEFAQGKGKLGDWAAGKVYDSMSRNPVSAINALVADKWLGFYDPGQFLVQAQTAFGAMATHPIWGAEAAAMTRPMTWLMVNQSDALLDKIAVTTAKWHQLGIPEFKQMVRTLRTSGIMNVSGEQIVLDNYMSKIGGNALARNFNKFRQGGRYLYIKGNQFNRMTAYQIAWKDTRRQFPELDYTSTEFTQRVANKTDALDMRMATNSRAFWQQGVLAIPTKFMAYQVRMLEAILPASLGGEKSLRGAEKGMLALSQLLMYGAAGLPFTGELTNYAAMKYSEATGKPLDKDTWRMISRGFWDDMMYRSTGLETDFSARAAIGKSWGMLFDSFNGGGNKTTLEILGGATAEASSTSLDAARQLIDYIRAEQINPLDAQDWAFVGSDILQQVASGARISRAYAIWQLGFLRDPKTGEKLMDTNSWYALPALLGIPIGDQSEKYTLMNSTQNREKFAKDFGGMLAQNRNNAMDALIAHDQRKADYYFKKASGLAGIYKSNPALEKMVLEEADKLVSYHDSFQRVRQKYEQEFGVAPPGGM